VNDGFIIIHRKILDNPVVCKDNDYFRVWLYLLLNVSHKTHTAIFNGEKIILNPGQLITGRKSISGKCNVSESKVQRILKSFEIEQQIKQQTTNKNRLITVLNWCKYQFNEQQGEQQVNNKRTTNEQQVNTNNNGNNVTMKTMKNNIKENIKRKVDDYETVINDYTDNEDLINAAYSFIEMRKKIKKPLTDYALKLIFNKLADNDADKINILNQSIIHSWQGVFELKNNKGEINNGNSKDGNENNIGNTDRDDENEWSEILKKAGGITYL